MVADFAEIGLEERLKGLQEWRAKVLKSLPDAYTKSPNYMAMMDKQIAEIKAKLAQ